MFHFGISSLAFVDVKGDGGGSLMIGNADGAELILVAHDILLKGGLQTLGMLWCFGTPGSTRAKSMIKSLLECVMMAKLAYSPCATSCGNSNCRLCCSLLLSFILVLSHFCCKDSKSYQDNQNLLVLFGISLVFS